MPSPLGYRNVNNLVSNLKANPRDFYLYIDINGKKKDAQGYPLLKKVAEVVLPICIESNRQRYSLASSWMCSMKKK